MSRTLRDPRLTGETIHETFAAERLSLETAYPDFSQTSCIARLAELALRDLEDATVPTPPRLESADVPPALRSAFETIWDAVLRRDEGGFGQHDAAIWLVQQACGARLAQLLADKGLEWRPFLEATLPWEIKSAFCEFLSATSIQKNFTEVLGWAPKTWRAAANERYLQREREVSAAADRIPTRPNENLWAFAGKLDDLTAYMLPDFLAGFGTELSARAGADFLRQWLSAISHPLALAIVAGDIRHAGTLLDTLAQCALHAPEGLTPVLLSERFVYCVEALDGAFAHSVRVREGDAKQEARLVAWREKELPAYEARFTTILAAPPMRAIAYSACDFLAAQGGRSGAVDSFPIRERIRTELVRKLVEVNGLACTLQSILPEGSPTVGALFAAALAVNVNPTPDAALNQRVLSAYGAWLSTKDFYFPNGNAAALCWQLAGVLAGSATAEAWVQDTLAHVGMPREGWKSSRSSAHGDVDRRAHLFIVLAMCPEHLKSKDPLRARRMFLTAWAAIHRWVRLLADTMRPDHVGTSLAHFWARLPHLVDDPEQTVLALEEMARLDSIEWLVQCADNFSAQRPAKSLPTPCIALFIERFRLKQSTWELRLQTDANTKSAMLKSFKRLALEVDDV